MGNVIDGKTIATLQASVLQEKIRSSVNVIDGDDIPFLVIVQYGENSASRKYVQKKKEKAEELGIIVAPVFFNETISFESVLRAVQEMNAGCCAHGIMIQHPIPHQHLLREQELFDAISPEKDVDGLSSLSQGRLFTGQKGFQACTAKGIMRLLDLHTSLIGKHVAIIGASNIVGKPLAVLLMNEGASVTSLQRSSREEDVKYLCQYSDIIISACGVPGRIREDYIRPGVILIDAGYKDGVGDIHPNCYEKSSYFTPVPNGVGPMTVITLLEHVVEAFMKRYEL